jgi:nicotinamide-nucleotide amidase
MEFLMEHNVIPFLRQHYDLHGVIKTRVLHTVGVGESQIDDKISDLEELSNPTVGLAAHSGQVDVRITAKADSEEASAILITQIENTLRDRLGDCIYGADNETVEEIALRSIAKHNWTLTVVEAGSGGYLIHRLASTKGPFLVGQVLTVPPSPDKLLKLADSYRQSHHAEVGLGVAIHPSKETYDVDLVLITPLETRQINRRYGGPSEYAPLWAFNQSLDMIRRIPHDT